MNFQFFEWGLVYKFSRVKDLMLFTAGEPDKWMNLYVGELEGSRTESAGVTWVMHPITAINNGSRLDKPLSAYTQRAARSAWKTRHTNTLRYTHRPHEENARLQLLSSSSRPNGMQWEPSSKSVHTSPPAAGGRSGLTCTARVKKTPASEASFFTLKSMMEASGGEHTGGAVLSVPAEGILRISWAAGTGGRGGGWGGLMSGTVIRFVHDRKSAHRPALKETPHRAASHDFSGSPAAVLNLHMTSPDTFTGSWVQKHCGNITNLH